MAHTIYSLEKSQSKWKDLIYFAKEELTLSMDLIGKAIAGDLIRVTDSSHTKQVGDLKRLYHVKQQDLLKIVSKLSTDYLKYQDTRNKQKEWMEFVINAKQRNWIINRMYKLDYGFWKIGSNLDYKVEIRKDLKFKLLQNNFLKLKLNNKTSSGITDLVSRENGVFLEIEMANFGVLDKEIMELLIKGDLEEKYRNLKKGNEWILKGFELLEISSFQSQDMDLEEDDWLNVLVIMLRYRMLQVYKRNFKNRGISSDSSSTVYAILN